ncbi:MAG TPA: GvpL/GvpF family gas vesicle protein [Longimicrobiaceae bacterium]|nr:GvpL/GvpF family gas vesicle protein [Longimicrobiaceae bacterium]
MTSPAAPAAPRRAAPRGLSLLGVISVNGEPPEWDPADPRLGVRLVGYEDVAALVCPAPPAGADADPLHVTARHWEVHRALLRGDVVPAPAGVVFASDGELVAFLTEAYASLRAALARVKGCWEFRLHVDVADAAFSPAKALDLATHIYAELRRASRGALTYPHEGAQRVLSAAFLVERAGSDAFRDRVEELSRLNAALELEVTGPWPPYDFVAMHPPARPAD